VDTQFTEAVMAGALETLYARIPVPLGVDRQGNPVVGINFRAVEYWRSKFKEIEIDAKKWINNLDSTESRTLSYDHSGLYTSPKEAKDANITPTSWT
jgi:hypothetical protein